MNNDQAVETTTEIAPEAAPLAQISVIFTADGSLQVHMEGVRPHQFWAAGAMLSRLGDSMFDEQRAVARNQQAQEQADMKAAIEALRGSGRLGPGGRA